MTLRKTVVLGDRHSQMIEGMRGLLESMFDTVVMVADRESLFSSVEGLTPDLAVVDLSLPESTEGNIARQLKKRYPNLKLVILSIHEQPTVVDQVMKTGAEAVVLKRTAATDLLPAVEEVLKGCTYVSPCLKAQGEG